VVGAVPWLRVVVGLVLAFVLTHPLPGQGVRREPAVLSGTVTDLDGQPLANVGIDVTGSRRRATTDARGKFRVEGLQSGSAFISVRRIGLAPMLLEAQLVAGENILTVTMEPVAQRLDAVRTDVEQTALFGVVGDTAFDIVPGAQVSTIVHKATTLTNEKGQFFFDPIKPGADMVEVRKFGYRPRIISFTVPPKGGQKIVVWLTPLPSGLDSAAMAGMSALSNRVVQSLWEFGFRRRTANVVKSRFATRELLAERALGIQLEDALRLLPNFAGISNSDIICLVSDGQVFTGRGVEGLMADEVETLEVLPVADLPTADRETCSAGASARATSIGGGSQRGSRLNIGGRTAARAGAGGSASGYAAVVMLRH
jgi:hypothetical protein